MASSLSEIESQSEGGEDAEGFDSMEEDGEGFESDYEYVSSDSSCGGCPSEFLQMQPLFNQEPVRCSICREDNVEQGLAVVLPCRHSFCVECLTLCVEAQIGEGDADNITCPFVYDATGGKPIGRRCSASIEADVLREIMPPERYTRLQRQKDSAFVRKNPDYHHCPTPDCDNVVLCRVVDLKEGGGGGGVGARICDCFKCGHTSCLNCGARPFHFKKTCDEHREEQRRKAEIARRRTGLHQIQFGGLMYAPPDVDQSRANEEARYTFDLESDPPGDDPGLGEALGNVRRCRRCGNGVELADGCLKMKCLCGYRFCYQCGAENAVCGCTPSHHGFVDNVTGRADFAGLASTKSYT